MESFRLFNARAREYDEWFEKRPNRPAYLSELKAVRKMLPEEGGKGLEVGVGTGRFAHPLGVRVGIDPSFNMLKAARERGVKAVCARAEGLPFRKETFDYILNIVTLCFVDNPGEVILESKRVLRDRGRIIIGIVDKEGFLGRAYQKKESKFYKVAKFYSVDEVTGLLRRCGFKKVLTCQTIFQPLDRIEEVEGCKEGSGEGGFVVIRGEK